MKKIFTLLTFGAFAGSLLAQQVGTVQTPAHGRSVRRIALPPSSAHPMSVASTNSRWYNYGEAVDAQVSGTYPGTTAYAELNYLFPDTTILANFGGTYGGPWIHFLGDVLDPTSSYFNDHTVLTGVTGPVVTSSTAYNIDSVQVAVYYVRNTSAAITDSMIIELGQVSKSVGYFTGDPVPTNLGTDTVFLQNLLWNQPTHALTATNRTRYAVALTAASAADTVAGGVHYVTLACPSFPAISAGKLAVSSIYFKPGYTWVANHDTLGKKNELDFLSYHEMGNNTTFPTKYQKHDLNASYIIPNDVYYNQSVGAWNGSYVPSFAYDGGTTDNFAYEHHLIYYHLTCATCTALSTNDIAASGFSIGNAYPNPVVAGTNVVVPISIENKEKTQIAIYNVVGQKMGATLEPSLVTGANEVTLNTKNLEAGIYFVSVSVGTSVKTVRLVVTQ